MPPFTSICHRRLTSAFHYLGIIANKIDLCANDDVEGSGPRRRQVTTEEADLWAKEEGLLFLEASAKTGDNVDEVSCLGCVCVSSHLLKIYMTIYHTGF